MEPSRTKSKCKRRYYGTSRATTVGPSRNRIRKGPEKECQVSTSTFVKNASVHSNLPPALPHADDTTIIHQPSMDPMSCQRSHNKGRSRSPGAYGHSDSPYSHRNGHLQLESCANHRQYGQPTNRNYHSNNRPHLGGYEPSNYQLNHPGNPFNPSNPYAFSGPNAWPPNAPNLCFPPPAMPFYNGAQGIPMGPGYPASLQQYLPPPQPQGQGPALVPQRPPGPAHRPLTVSSAAKVQHGPQGITSVTQLQYGYGKDDPSPTNPNGYNMACGFQQGSCETCVQQLAGLLLQNLHAVTGACQQGANAATNGFQTEQQPVPVVQQLQAPAQQLEQPVEALNLQANESPRSSINSGAVAAAVSPEHVPNSERQTSISNGGNAVLSAKEIVRASVQHDESPLCDSSPQPRTRPLTCIVINTCQQNSQRSRCSKKKSGFTPSMLKPLMLGVLPPSSTPLNKRFPIFCYPVVSPGQLMTALHGRGNIKDMALTSFPAEDDSIGRSYLFPSADEDPCRLCHKKRELEKVHVPVSKSSRRHRRRDSNASYSFEEKKELSGTDEPGFVRATESKIMRVKRGKRKPSDESCTGSSCSEDSIVYKRTKTRKKRHKKEGKERGKKYDLLDQPSDLDRAAAEFNKLRDVMYKTETGAD